jgi:hypothetical protein
VGREELLVEQLELQELQEELVRLELELQVLTNTQLAQAREPPLRLLELVELDRREYPELRSRLRGKGSEESRSQSLSQLLSRLRNLPGKLPILAQELRKSLIHLLVNLRRMSNL